MTFSFVSTLALLFFLGFGFAQNNVVSRAILVESFSGHTCGNAPSMHKNLDSLKMIYGDTIEYVVIHPENVFTEPQFGSGSFETDFRIEEGEQINNDFMIPPFCPLTMVSRGTSLNSVGGFDFFQNDAVQEIANRVGLLSDFIIYSSAVVNQAREVEVNLEVIIVNSINGDYGVVSYLVEDSIVDWQTSFPGQDSNYSGAQDNNYDYYIHRNVLRDIIGHEGIVQGITNSSGNIYGDSITGSTNAGSVKNYFLVSYPMDISWDENKMSVVSYVHDRNTKEILQVNRTKVQVSNTINVVDAKVNIKIYPNPNNGFLFVELDHWKDVSMEIYNSVGQVVYRQPLQGSNTTIDLRPNFIKGVYFVRLMDKQKGVIKTIKMMVN